ncbi:MAG: ATP-dependent DNA helicase RecG, partial [Gammaproteobacteria bacterium]|nr:ATP-dependent DNA helicase RecG [Gammaproteobacteria bacterium]
MAEKLHGLGIHEPADLLFHLPFRYQDRTRIRSIGSVRPGQFAIVEGKIVSANIQFGKRRSLLVRITDGTGFLTIRLFHFTKNQQQSFVEDKLLQCFGEMRYGLNSLEMVHPEYLFSEHAAKSLVETHLTPVYHLTEGIQQHSLRKIIAQALDYYQHGKIHFADFIPKKISRSLHLPSLAEALIRVHQPNDINEIPALLEFSHPAQTRLVLEELVAHHLSLKKLRLSTQQHPAPALKAAPELIAKFISNLPFNLTGAQQRVSEEVCLDMIKPVPMLRLVQGDVGSGKTIVAMLAALQAIANGYQVAFMAPTEMLAEQHFQNCSNWADPLGIQVGWLSGKQKGKSRQQALEALQAGEIQLLVGTHALFQDDVIYHHLGLVIIDEQHRFGVHQRLALKEKGRPGSVPHQLIMTATPIPRTLAMTAYADLDLSIIDELPAGRQTIDTVVIGENRRGEIIERINAACISGKQAYWVCPLIEESEALNCQAAEKTAELLKQQLPEISIGLVHGRMKADEKSRTMAAFKSGEISLLVATTVIEVGVDVPNASMMIIENAERLGLSQLHQLRGRVGRGAVKSSCVLMYSGKLSKTGKERLGIMRRSNDGFEIAEKDLEIRGPGELL